MKREAEPNNETPGSSSSAPNPSAPTPAASTSLSTPQSPSKGKEIVGLCLQCQKDGKRCDGERPCARCQRRTIYCRYEPPGINTQSGPDAAADEISENPPKRRRLRSYKPPTTPTQGHQAAEVDRRIKVEDDEPVKVEPHLPEDDTPTKVEPRSPEGSIPSKVEAHLPEENKPIKGEAPLPEDNKPVRDKAPLPEDNKPVRGEAPLPEDNKPIQSPAFPQFDGLLGDFDEIFHVIGTDPSAATLFSTLDALSRVWGTLRREEQNALKPAKGLVDPKSPLKERMTKMLPPQDVCNKLIRVYFLESEGLYRTTRLSVFEKEYNEFWDGESNTHDSFLPRLLCMLCLAAQFGKGWRGRDRDGNATIHIPTAYALVGEWLDERTRTDTFDISTLQTKLLHFFARKLISAKKSLVWVEVGYLARMGMQLGLHRDPMIQGASISAGEKESRRRLWFTLMELDVQTSIHLNLPCTFSWESVACASPGNFDEKEIEVDTLDVPFSRPLEEVTENHLQAYASGTLRVRTQAVELLARVGAWNYEEVLTITRQLEKTLTNIAKLFPTALGKPLSAPSSGHPEWRRRVYLDLHVRVPLMAIYRRYGLRNPDCPPDIRRGFLNSSMAVLAFLEVDRGGGGGASGDGGDPSATRVMLSMLRGVMVSAVLIVCHFIKSARGPDWEDGDGGAPEIFGWDVDCLLRTVDTALEKMLGFVEMTGSASVGELIALSIVREVVQAGSISEKVGEVQLRFDRIMGACLKVAASMAPPKRPGTSAAIDTVLMPPPSRAQARSSSSVSRATAPLAGSVSTAPTGGSTSTAPAGGSVSAVPTSKSVLMAPPTGAQAHATGSASMTPASGSTSPVSTSGSATTAPASAPVSAPASGPISTGHVSGSQGNTSGSSGSTPTAPPVGAASTIHVRGPQGHTSGSIPPTPASRSVPTAPASLAIATAPTSLAIATAPASPAIATVPASGSVPTALVSRYVPIAPASPAIATAPASRYVPIAPASPAIATELASRYVPIAPASPAIATELASGSVPTAPASRSVPKSPMGHPRVYASGSRGPMAGFIASALSRRSDIHASGSRAHASSSGAYASGSRATAIRIPPQVPCSPTATWGDLSRYWNFLVNQLQKQ